MDVLKNYKKLQEDFKFEFDLKKEQEEIIDSILKKQHTFGILPTGFGKSLTFIVPPLLMDISIPSVRHHTIVICPLVALMKDQCSSLQRRGVSATYISQRCDMDDTTVEGIREGAYTVLYMSPEALVTMEWRCLIFDNSIYKNCTTIAVDEVHLLELWGDEFRPTFRAIGELRSHFPDTPFLLLSATVEEEMYSRILHHLHIGSDEVTLVAADPDRPNLFLEWRTATRADASNHLLPYLEKLKETQLDCPKSIIYVSVVTKKSIRQQYKCHVDRELDLEEKSQINELVLTYITKCAEKQCSPDNLSPSNKENVRSEKNAIKIKKDPVTPNKTTNKGRQKILGTSPSRITPRKSPRTHLLKGKSPRNSPRRKKRSISSRLKFDEVITAVMDSEASSSSCSQSDSEANASSDGEQQSNMNEALMKLKRERDRKIKMSQERKNANVKKTSLTGKHNPDAASSDSVVLLTDEVSDCKTQKLKKTDKMETKQKRETQTEVIESDSDATNSLATPRKELESDSGSVTLNRTPENYHKRSSKLANHSNSNKSPGRDIIGHSNSSVKRKVLSESDSALTDSEKQCSKRRKLTKHTNVRKHSKKKNIHGSKKITDDGSSSEDTRPTRNNVKIEKMEVFEIKTNSDSDTPLSKTWQKQARKGLKHVMDSDSSAFNSPVVKKRNSTQYLSDSESSTEDTPLIQKKQKLKGKKQVSSDENTEGKKKIGISKCRPKRSVSISGSGSESSHIESDSSTDDTPLIKKWNKNKLDKKSEADTPRNTRQVVKGKSSKAGTGTTSESDSEFGSSNIDVTPVKVAKKKLSLTKGSSSGSESADNINLNLLSKRYDKMEGSNPSSSDNEDNSFTRNSSLLKKQVLQKRTPVKNQNSISARKSSISSNSDSDSSVPETTAKRRGKSEKYQKKRPSNDNDKTSTLGNCSGDSEDDDAPLSKFNGRRSSSTRTRSSSSSGSDSEEIPLSKVQVTVKKAAKPSKTRSSSSSGSDSEEIPLSKVQVKVTKAAKPLKTRSSSSSGSDSEEIPLSKVQVKVTKAAKPSKTRSSSSSGSDSEDIPLSKVQVKVTKAAKPSKKSPAGGSGGSTQLKRLRQICRSCGMFIRNDRELKGCTTDKQKVARLKETLKKVGMEGQPSLKKAEAVRLMKEAAELNSENIISSEPSHGKRRVRSRYARRSATPVASPRKPSPKKATARTFTRLKGIVDSEGSSDEG